MEQEDRHSAGLAYLLTTAWAEHAAADALDPAGRAVHPAVKEAARLLRDVPAAVQWKLPELAGRAGLSPSRLSRLFKAETGVPLVEFRQRRQLDRFLAIYDGGASKLLPAALSAGFGSYPQFYRVHRRLLGARPREPLPKWGCAIVLGCSNEPRTKAYSRSKRFMPSHWRSRSLREYAVRGSFRTDAT